MRGGLKMIKTVLVAALALASLTIAAGAADLPSKRATPEFEAPPPIPVFTWSGLYVGVHAGYQFGRDDIRFVSPVGSLQTRGYQPHGIIGGGHAGYNFATPFALGGNALVFGLEGDVDGADYSRGVGGLGGAVSTRSDIKGSVRGRIGIAVNRVLFYATGGAAFADFQTHYDLSNLFGPGAVDDYRRARVGYTVGGGVEYAMMNTLSVRAEYRYSDYGTFTDPLVNSVPAAPGLIRGAHRETDNRVQAGISYRFDSITPGPVVARY